MSFERLEQLRGEMKKCVRCSLCKIVPMPTIQQTKFISACPPLDHYHFHAYAGGGIQVMALSLLDGRIKVDEDLAKVVSACTTCGMCDVSCKFIMTAERQEVILALKEHIVEAGFGNKLKEIEIEKHNHWAQGLNIKPINESKSKILLLVGANANRDPVHAASARKLAQLLQHAKVDFGIIEDYEPNIGIEYYWTGHRKEFEKNADQVVSLLHQNGVKTIILLDGEDYGMLHSKYPYYGRPLNIQIFHASQYLLHLIKKRKLRLPTEITKKVTYHDPCYLGRQSEVITEWVGEEKLTHGVMRYFQPKKIINYGTKGVYDEPRQVLQAIKGLKFVEMYRIREYSYCCGGGGGVPNIHPNVSESASSQRIDEAKNVGAELMVTACQHCVYNFNKWQDGTPLPVIDLVDLVYEAAGLVN